MFLSKWFGNSRRELSSGIFTGINPAQDFRRTLARERAGADRNEHEFSVMLLDGAPLQTLRAAGDLIRKLRRRIRKVDEIGWFDKHRIGILLPFTSSSGARTLADDIRRLSMPTPPTITIYTYPGEWLPKETDSSGNDRSPDTLFDDGTPPWKRAMDIAVSAAALVILSPILLLIAITIWIVSPGPIFLKQKRVGYKGRPFVIWKFRTMRLGANTAVHQEHFNKLMTSDMPLTKLDLKGDPRIIPLGDIIRRCYLDELPQLINVLRGDMSLVGPRPCMAFAVSQYRLWQRMRCDAVPGMTGLWQVSGKNKTTFKEMLRLDITYIQRRSFGLDLRILLRTFPAIFGELMETVLNRKSPEMNAPGDVSTSVDTR